MDFKKHIDTVIILVAIITSFLWMNVNFSDLDDHLTRIETILKGKK